MESDAAQAVRALLEANASLQLHSHAKHALRSAAEREAKATVAVLRASGAADLHAAAILDDALMVQDCLKRGVDPNAPDHEVVVCKAAGEQCEHEGKGGEVGARRSEDEHEGARWMWGDAWGVCRG